MLPSSNDVVERVIAHVEQIVRHHENTTLAALANIERRLDALQKNVNALNRAQSAPRAGLWQRFTAVVRRILR